MRDPVTERILAAAIEVHRVLGPGLLEAIYVDALCAEFELRGIPCEREKDVGVFCKGRALRRQRVDLIACSEVVLEIKAQRPDDELFPAQTLSYLRCTGLKRALVLNFGLPTLAQGTQRVVLSGD